MSNNTILRGQQVDPRHKGIMIHGKEDVIKADTRGHLVVHVARGRMLLYYHGPSN